MYGDNQQVHGVILQTVFHFQKVIDLLDLTNLKEESKVLYRYQIIMIFLQQKHKNFVLSGKELNNILLMTN
jgi:hypothetical protein